jgi:mutual gliding-motility protein MglA
VEQFMAYFNKDTQEIHCKIVYVGAKNAGKTQNLRSIYQEASSGSSLQKISLSRALEENEYFEFMPLGLGDKDTNLLRLHLYTLPIRGAYDVLPQMIFKDVDAIVYVIDSCTEKMLENQEAIEYTNLLIEQQGINPEDIVHVYQYNKRDAIDIIKKEILDQYLNPNRYHCLSANVNEPGSAMETLLSVAKKLLNKIEKTELQT